MSRRRDFLLWYAEMGERWGFFPVTAEAVLLPVALLVQWSIRGLVQFCRAAEWFLLAVSVACALAGILTFAAILIYGGTE